jgi:hypothetical protein
MDRQSFGKVRSLLDAGDGCPTPVSKAFANDTTSQSRRHPYRPGRKWQSITTRIPCSTGCATRATLLTSPSLRTQGVPRVPQSSRPNFCRSTQRRMIARQQSFVRVYRSVKSRRIDLACRNGGLMPTVNTSGHYRHRAVVSQDGASCAVETICFQEAFVWITIMRWFSLSAIRFSIFSNSTRADAQ